MKSLVSRLVVVWGLAATAVVGAQVMEPYTLRHDSLRALATKIEGATVRVRWRIPPPAGFRAPVENRPSGIATLLLHAGRVTLLTVPPVGHDGAVMIERSGGRTATAKLLGESKALGLSALEVSAEGFLDDLLPLALAPVSKGLPRARDRRVFALDRFEPPDWARGPDRSLPAVGVALGPGVGHEAFFVRMSVVALRGEPIVNEQGLLLALSAGPSMQSSAPKEGLAVAGAFIREHLRRPDTDARPSTP